MKKKENLSEMSEDQLFERASKLRESLFRQRFKLRLGNQDVVKQIRADRKDLARVKTALRGREVKQEIEAGSRPAHIVKTRAARVAKTARTARGAAAGKKA